MNATLSLRLPEALLEQLGKLAEATGVSRNSVAVKAMQAYIESESWQVEEILDAIKEADAGNFATDEEVDKVFTKWSK